MEEVVPQLRIAYAGAADAERAAGEAAYMRNQFVFFGLRSADRRRLMSHVLAGVTPPDEAELVTLSRALWAELEREFHHTACDYIRANISVAGPGFLDTLHHLVTAKSWWDTVDPLAAHCVGPLVRRHPELVDAMDQWVLSDNLWMTRTAILHQLTFKSATDEDRLFRYCQERATERDFFIRKAIGWALRTYAAVAPTAVARFVAATPTLSSLSVKEATKGVARAS